MDEKHMLIAGATGNLGTALVETGLAHGHHVRAIARRSEPLARFQDDDRFELVLAQVTRSDELRGICDGIDAVISALGITRQRGPATFHDIDYQANVNLLEESARSG